MQTKLADFIKDTPQGQTADSILRACVHCGFCTATCPTYQLLGDELDGPRGRIYQIKQVLEGMPASATLQQHLDRCLTCRSCETTCPSGVNYHQLLDIGREVVEKQLPRPMPQRLQRKGMVWLFSSANRFGPALSLARLARPLLSKTLQRKVLPKPDAIDIAPASGHTRRMLILDGCVQPAIAPNINQATRKLLGQLDIDVEAAPKAGCCGALPQHLSEPEKALLMAKQNIDAWYPALQQDAEALIMTASGCGAHVKDYPHLLKDDPHYAEKAQLVADKTKDLVEILNAEDLQPLKLRHNNKRIAIHTPCTLQHGLGLNGQVDKLLQSLGYQLTQVADSHLCCGSAGTYSITQPEISEQLRERKRTALTVDHPDYIVTANIGCLSHLYDEDGPQIGHWINLIESDLDS